MKDKTIAFTVRLRNGAEPARRHALTLTEAAVAIDRELSAEAVPGQGEGRIYRGDVLARRYVFGADGKIRSIVIRRQ